MGKRELKGRINGKQRSIINERCTKVVEEDEFRAKREKWRGGDKMI